MVLLKNLLYQRFTMSILVFEIKLILKPIKQK